MKMLLSASCMGSYLQNIMMKNDLNHPKNVKFKDFNINMKSGIYIISNTASIKDKKDITISRAVINCRKHSMISDGPFKKYIWRVTVDNEIIDSMLSIKAKDNEVAYAVFLCPNDKHTDLNAYYVTYEDLKELLDYNGESTKLTITVDKTIKVGSATYAEISSRNTNNFRRNSNIATIFDVKEYIEC